MQRADTIWSGLDPLMDQRIASAYDQSAAQLQELRGADAQANNLALAVAAIHRHIVRMRIAVTELNVRREDERGHADHGWPHSHL